MLPARPPGARGARNRDPLESRRFLMLTTRPTPREPRDSDTERALRDIKAVLASFAPFQGAVDDEDGRLLGVLLDELTWDLFSQRGGGKALLAALQAEAGLPSRVATAVAFDILRMAAKSPHPHTQLLLQAREVLLGSVYRDASLPLLRATMFAETSESLTDERAQLQREKDALLLRTAQLTSKAEAFDSITDRSVDHMKDMFRALDVSQRTEFLSAVLGEVQEVEDESLGPDQDVALARRFARPPPPTNGALRAAVRGLEAPELVLKEVFRGRPSLLQTALEDMCDDRPRAVQLLRAVLPVPLRLELIADLDLDAVVREPRQRQRQPQARQARRPAETVSGHSAVSVAVTALIRALPTRTDRVKVFLDALPSSRDRSVAAAVMLGEVSARERTLLLRSALLYGDCSSVVGLAGEGDGHHLEPGPVDVEVASSTLRDLVLPLSAELKADILAGALRSMTTNDKQVAATRFFLGLPPAVVVLAMERVARQAPTETVIATVEALMSSLPLEGRRELQRQQLLESRPEQLAQLVQEVVTTLPVAANGRALRAVLAGCSVDEGLVLLQELCRDLDDGARERLIGGIVGGMSGASVQALFDLLIRSSSAADISQALTAKRGEEVKEEERLAEQAAEKEQQEQQLEQDPLAESSCSSESSSESDTDSAPEPEPEPVVCPACSHRIGDPLPPPMAVVVAPSPAPVEEAPVEEAAVVEKKPTVEDLPPEQRPAGAFVVPHSWAAFIAPKGGSGTRKPRSVNPKAIYTLIDQVYQEKLKADAIDRKKGTPVATMERFVTEFMLYKYGTRQLVSSRLANFVFNLRQYAAEDEWVGLFARFAGVLSPHIDLKDLNEFLIGYDTLTKELRQRSVTSLTKIELNRAAEFLHALTAGMHDLSETAILEQLRAYAYQEEVSGAWSAKAVKVSYVNMHHALQVYFHSYRTERDAMEQRLRDLFTEFDADGNGTLDFEEFVTLFNSLPTREGEEEKSRLELTKLFHEALAFCHGDADAITMDAWVSVASAQWAELLRAAVFKALEDSATPAGGGTEDDDSSESDQQQQQQQQQAGGFSISGKSAVDSTPDPRTRRASLRAVNQAALKELHASGAAAAHAELAASLALKSAAAPVPAPAAAPTRPFLTRQVRGLFKRVSDGAHLSSLPVARVPALLKALDDAAVTPQQLFAELGLPLLHGVYGVLPAAEFARWWRARALRGAKELLSGLEAEELLRGMGVSVPFAQVASLLQAAEVDVDGHVLGQQRQTELGEEWFRLAARPGSVFLSKETLFAWWDAFDVCDGLGGVPTQPSEIPLAMRRAALEALGIVCAVPLPAAQSLAEFVEAVRERRRICRFERLQRAYEVAATVHGFIGKTAKGAAARKIVPRVDN